MNSPRPTDRAFGLIFGVTITTSATIAWLVFEVEKPWLFGLAVVFFLIAIAHPTFLMPLNRLWVRFAGYLGLFNNWVLLTVFYYCSPPILGTSCENSETLFSSADPGDSYRRGLTQISWLALIAREGALFDLIGRKLG